MAKKAAQYEQHRQRMAANQREQSAAGRDIGAIPPIANQERRDQAGRSLRMFCEIYHSATFHLGWSDDHIEVLGVLERVCREGGKFCLAMPRGGGKTSLTIAAAEWALLYGYRLFAVVVSATADEAKKVVETIRATFEQNALLQADFPEACYPVKCLGGISQRAAGQTHKGIRTRITWTGRELVLPTIEGSPSSGAAVYSVGITGSVRGLSILGPDGTTRRPDVVMINDPQTDESARSLAEINRRERSCMGALAKLGGPGESIAMVATTTIIEPGDLAARLLDPKRHPEMQGRRYAILRSMPDRMDLWQKYRDIRAQSLAEYGDIRDATAFYVEHREAMDRGAEAAWELRKESQHASAIQYAMDAWAEDEISFWAEYMNAPLNRSLANVESLDAEKVAERYSGVPRGVVPDWCELLTAAVDVQAESLWWVLAGWDKFMRGHVVEYGVFPEHAGYVTNNDIRRTLAAELGLDTFEDCLREGLIALAGELLGGAWQTQSGADISCSRLGVDANWSQSTDVVYEVARTNYPGKFVPMHGRYVGAAGSTVDQWRGEKGDKRGPGWLMQKGRRQQQHCVFDSNQIKSWLAGQLSAEVGISLPGSSSVELAMLADNLAAEYGTVVEARTGRKCTEWRCRPGRDNHLGDCLVMSAVLASIEGGQLPGQVVKDPPRRYSASERQRANRNRRRA